MFDTGKFINIVKENPAIWDSHSLDYINKKLRMETWQRVAFEMFENFDLMALENQIEKIKDLQKKWRNIKDSFVKDLRSQKAKLGDPLRRRSKYGHFDSLLFLMPLYENICKFTNDPSIQSQSNGPSSSTPCHELEVNNDDSSLAPCYSENSVEIPSVEVHLSTGTESIDTSKFLNSKDPVQCFKKLKKGSKKIKVELSENELARLRLIHNADDIFSVAEDGDKLFIYSLLPLFRELPTDKKLTARLELTSVLQKLLVESMDVSVHNSSGSSEFLDATTINIKREYS